MGVDSIGPPRSPKRGSFEFELRNGRSRLGLRRQLVPHDLSVPSRSVAPTLAQVGDLKACSGTKFLTTLANRPPLEIPGADPPQHSPTSFPAPPCAPTTVLTITSCTSGVRLGNLSSIRFANSLAQSVDAPTRARPGALRHQPEKVQAKAQNATYVSTNNEANKCYSCSYKASVWACTQAYPKNESTKLPMVAARIP